ncbi:MAG: beta-N-acetylglucosaminidase [Promethearchaeota archaeon]|nr:MAG: beta-N-acetylglucosaminidase [Candidatus Lokiarchaeota archaeon]
MNSIKGINIIPEPVSMTISTGKFTLTNKTTIYTDKDLLKISEFLKVLIRPATGFNLKIKEYKGSKNFSENSIILQLTDNNINLGSEGYLLSVTSQQVNITAKNPAGIFYGIQTLRQLLPVEIESKKIINNVEWEIYCLTIEDFPRFSWRGYMLDEARHFHGKEVVKKLLELMALIKINIFHWHLTNDQGWRIEIKKYPKLTKIGSKREETQVGGLFSKKRDGIPHSGYYTQEDIQDIIDYAGDRFIKIVPEIDMPGHTRAALASYPNLSCKGYPFRVSTHWGFHKDVMCVGKEEVFEFIQNVLKEIVDLFPSNIVHIGGDEVLKQRWKKCPDCQLRLEKEGLKNEKELQTYFTNRIIAFLNNYKQKIVIWNDALNKNLDGKPICQYWLRRMKEVREYLKKGGDVIMSNFKFTYLDHAYSFTPLNLAYKFEPIPKKLEKKYHKHVLGLEAPMWGEYIPNIKRLEWQTFPRLIAFAEIGWTPKLKKNFNSFQERLNIFLKRFDIIGINYANLREVKGNVLKRSFKVFTLFSEQSGGI